VIKKVESATTAAAIRKLAASAGYGKVAVAFDTEGEPLTRSNSARSGGRNSGDGRGVSPAPPSGSTKWHGSGVAAQKLIEAATHELTGVRKAALTAGRRMQALELAAEAIHEKTLLTCTARLTSTPEAGLHALLTDAHGTTIEISGGQLAASISKD
jgi:hypothetical protein